MNGTIFLTIVLGIIVYFVYIYNSIVKQKNNVESAWSDIEVQLKKRFNLIPNLVEIVKSYKDYEASTLEKIVEARNKFQNSANISGKIEATKELMTGISGIFAIAEAYPELKANEEYKNLQNQLVSLETDIEQARRYYNAVVRDYNNTISVFPNVIIAKQFGFEKLPYFEIDKSEQEEVHKTPRIKL